MKSSKQTARFLKAEHHDQFQYHGDIRLPGRQALYLRFDDGPAWEYEILDTSTLKWREEGKTEWQEEIYQAFEPAPDIIVYSHICTGSKPLRCLTQAVDFSKALATCVDAQMGNGRKPWEVGRTVHFGVLETEGGPVPPAVERHGFTTDLVGKAFAWIYGDFMQSIHVYSTPESYSWTIILPQRRRLDVEFSLLLYKTPG